MCRLIARILVALTALAGAIQAGTMVANAAPPAGIPLTGTVSAGGQPLSGASVTLFSGSNQGISRLGRTITGSNGGFSINYVSPTLGVLYLSTQGGTSAMAPVPSALKLTSVVGVLGGGGVPPHTFSTVDVNELTTVAATYSLAQFISPAGISGPSPGLENAAATTFNLVNPGDGQLGAVITNANNGLHNSTSATLNTVANLVALCASRESRARCREVLRLATPAGISQPHDTVLAVQNLAKYPTLSPTVLWALAKTANKYQPILTHPPTAWILALLYTDTGLYASGRIAIDAMGNIWSSNNWDPGTTNPSTVVTVLNPVGNPILGSPISGGGVNGGAWGTAISQDGSVWFGNVAKNEWSMSQFSSNGSPESPSTGWTNGNLEFPQGVAVDQKGNVWIANNYGPETAPDQGDVVVYPGGNPAKAITITGGGINHPFAIQIDGQGRAWVTNEGLGGAKLVNTKLAPLIGKFGGSVTIIGPNFKVEKNSPIQSKSFRFPLGIALDAESNAWIVSYINNTVIEIRPNGTIARTVKLPGPFFPWSDAVDGSGRVWVAGFSKPGVWLICGTNAASCPKGSRTGTLLSPKSGFRSSAMQHFTSIQIDSSGNVWLSNNWSKILTGGDGIVELIGMATPVCTPLIGLPIRPKMTTSCAGSA